VTSQVIRIVTEKVMENISRQVRQQHGETPAMLSAPPDVMAVLSAMHQQIVQTQGALAALAARIDEIEARAEAVEHRWGWPLWGAIVGAVALAFLLGFVAANVLRVFG
jgi:hypothetical protein